MDSEIPKLKFTITEDVDHGRLLLFVPATGETVELRAGSPHNSFLQDDLDNGRLKYTHNFQDPTSAVSFIFDLSDPEGNTLPNQNFRIRVSEDRIPMEKLKNEGITVKEKGHEPITNQELEYTDSNSPPDRLKFTVTSGPDQGRLEKVDQVRCTSEAKIILFSQECGIYCICHFVFPAYYRYTVAKKNSSEISELIRF